MKYPQRTSYNVAVRNIDKFVFDSILKQGIPATQKDPNFLRVYNGGKAIVYEIEVGSKRYALKCWVEDLGSLKFRYKEIDAYLRSCKLPYFVDFAYIEQGILVSGEKFPIVRMEWISGINLKDFISRSLNNPARIHELSKQFLVMTQHLHEKDISHGDLQHNNIMIDKKGEICLIDYDSLFVPKLSKEKDNIKGLPGYQHPKRNTLRKLSSKADYFSELVIYLSLLVLSEDPSYWDDIKDEDDRLLFSKDDFLCPKKSKVFKEIRVLSPEIEYLVMELEKSCKETNINNLQPIEKITKAYKGETKEWTLPSKKSDGINHQSSYNHSSKRIDWDVFKTADKVHSEENTNSDLWEAAFSEDIWKKLDNVTHSSKDIKEQISQSPGTQASEQNSFWDKFETLWDKVTSSITSLLNIFSNIFKK
ncbi:MAG: Protein kinase domain [Phormidesmis priestleyi Ana]|uniref:Protein kinase domain n=1 Tax=Phormidesmis priestleyi Ana TaxID=1666911 RepID=A0A0P7ZGK9_9CYAN|nr:MAG: Protein kinase domain [Phormidesmis priestleyi Ana]